MTCLIGVYKVLTLGGVKHLPGIVGTEKRQATVNGADLTSCIVSAACMHTPKSGARV